MDRGSKASCQPQGIRTDTVPCLPTSYTVELRHNLFHHALAFFESYLQPRMLVPSDFVISDERNDVGAAVLSFCFFFFRLYTFSFQTFPYP